MMLACVICVFVACLAFCVISCVLPKTLGKFFTMLSFSAFVCLGIVLASYKNDFGGFSIFLIISVLPLYVSIFEIKDFAKPSKTENFQNYFSPDENLPVFVKMMPNLTNGIAFSLSGLCLFFASLYIGKESVFSLLLAISAALFATFLHRIISKHKFENAKKETWFFLDVFLVFLGAAFALSIVLPVLMFSVNLKSILFCLGALAYAGFCVTSLYWKNKYVPLVQYFAIILMFSAILA